MSPAWAVRPLALAFTVVLVALAWSTSALADPEPARDPDAGVADASVKHRPRRKRDAGHAHHGGASHEAQDGAARDTDHVEPDAEETAEEAADRKLDEARIRAEEAEQAQRSAEDARLDVEEAKQAVKDEKTDAKAIEAAHAEAPEHVPDFVEKMPQGVQDAITGTVTNMVVSRDPPDRFLFGIFGLPRGRFGSGTSWLPDASPLYAAVPHFGKWGLLLHGNVYTGYSWYSSDRGGSRFMGRNTLMGALFRTFRRSELLFRVALSLEPLTIGKRGYPQVLQTGQTTDGTRIADTMYALDFFREVAITYTWEVTPKWAGLIYGALAGEPALGPVNFTQRISASADPLAPLGFQAQEPSHASFGVLTVGAFTRELKLEASWFNGEVPGSRRYGIYLRTPDSYSLRATWNPHPFWSLQGSYGFLEQPVAKEPGTSQHRLSFSTTYTKWQADGSGVASTASFAERIATNGDISTAFMLEAYWNLDGNHSLFGRAELLQKTARELLLPNGTSELFAVGSVAAGYIYYFGPYITLAPGLGVRASINPMEDDLSRFYGTQVAYGLMAFAQLRTTPLSKGPPASSLRSRAEAPRASTRAPKP